MKFVIFDSHDFDGICSAEIIRHRFTDEDVGFIPADYGRLTDVSMIPDGAEVFIVDFSLTVAEMEKLHARCDLTWIDHHKTAIEKCKHMSIKGLQLVGSAACELTWDHLFSDTAPYAVHLLGRYDVWDHSDPKCLPFQYGMKAFGMKLGDPRWSLLFEDYSELIHEIIRTGKIIMDHEEKFYERVCQGIGFTALLPSKHGMLKVFALNVANQNSRAAQSGVTDEHEAVCLFSWNGRQFKYSLYGVGKDIDLSMYAVERGGGGHKNACGFFSPVMELERVNESA